MSTVFDVLFVIYRDARLFSTNLEKYPTMTMNNLQVTNGSSHLPARYLPSLFSHIRTDPWNVFVFHSFPQHPQLIQL